MTPTSAPARLRRSSRSRAAEASGSTGRRTTVSGAGAFEASTPAEPQTKPCRVRAIINELGRLVEDHLDPARIGLVARELARLLARLDVREHDDPALDLRHGLLRDDDHVPVGEVGALGDEAGEVVSVA
jgi:hypothetical protein